MKRFFLSSVGFVMVSFCISFILNNSVNSAQAGQPVGKSVKIISSQVLSKNPSFRGKFFETPDPGRLLQVRINIIEKPQEFLQITSLDFTLRYKYPGSIGTADSKVVPCEGLRWHGSKIDDSKDWLILFPEERKAVISVGTSHPSSGNDTLDLLFVIHKDAKNITLQYATEIGMIQIK
jgi:hypothetical protein